MRITLLTGHTVSVKQSGGVYRIDHDGRHFMSNTIEGLRRALGQYHIIWDEPPKEIPPTMEEKLIKIFLGNNLPLKQASKRHLYDYKDDPRIMEIIQKLDTKPPVSRDALNLERRLKKEFHMISHEEMSQHIKDLVLRHRMMDELSKRWNVDA